jgi:twitching motility two-component system response regulator PilH
MAQGPTVLIIDDSATSCHVMETILRNDGYRVKSVGEGREGLTMVLRELPRCVILDVVLPGMSGFEVCRHLRANDYLQGLPIIMVSTKSTPLDKAWALRQGATHYLVKPFADDVFSQLVKEAVTNYMPPVYQTPGYQPRVAYASRQHAAPEQNTAAIPHNTAAIPSYVEEMSPAEHFATHSKIPTYRQMNGTSSDARNDSASPHFPLHKLIPLHNQNADPKRGKNAYFLNGNDVIRKLYEAIDGQSDIETLCAITKLSREDIMRGLRSLLTQRYIRLREPSGNVIHG